MSLGILCIQLQSPYGSGMEIYGSFMQLVFRSYVFSSANLKFCHKTCKLDIGGGLGFTKKMVQVPSSCREHCENRLKYLIPLTWKMLRRGGFPRRPCRCRGEPALCLSWRGTGCWFRNGRSRGSRRRSDRQTLPGRSTSSGKCRNSSHFFIAKLDFLSILETEIFRFLW